MNNTINKGLTMNDTTLTMVQNTSQGGRGGVRGAEGGAAVRYIIINGRDTRHVYTGGDEVLKRPSAQDGSILPRGQAGPATVHCLGQITRGHIKEQL